MKKEWLVGSFGRDCMGNVSGYRVYRSCGQLGPEVAHYEVANIYEPGSHDAAHAFCVGAARDLNAAQQ